MVFAFPAVIRTASSRGGFYGGLTSRNDASSRTQTPLVRSETPAGPVLHPGSVLRPETENTLFQSASGGHHYPASSGSGGGEKDGRRKGSDGKTLGSMSAAAGTDEIDHKSNEEHLKVSLDDDTGSEVALSGKWRPISIKPDSDNVILSDNDEGDTGL
jgi:hypothetical protein